MSDLCHQNTSECLNNGQCVVNILLNLTSCQCDPCHEGVNCEYVVGKETQYDTTYVYLIVYIIGLGLAILNNILSLELFIGSRQIRQTNCGIYLIIYCILSLTSSILLVVGTAVQYYPNQLMKNPQQYAVFGCFTVRLGYNLFVYLCIWFSSCVAFERGLYVYFNGRMNAGRCRSLITTLVIFAIASGSATPLLLSKCDWDKTPSLHVTRAFFVSFYPATGIIIYVSATVLILISFTNYIRRHKTENSSCIKTFLKLLYTHLFIFVPPIGYAVGFIPYAAVYHIGSSQSSYFPCGISTAEFIIKVLVEAFQGLPFVITWLLFIYPSKVYMNEFYLKTWSGQRLVKIIMFFASCCNKEKSSHPSTRSRIGNEHAMECYIVEINN